MQSKFLKYFFLFSIIMVTITANVNAESKYLYDVLKTEAESGGLAKEYTGEHHDSFTEEPSKKIYHWYAENDEEGSQVLEKNNIIFGGFCWQMIRTTDTGGVKMIYNGIPSEGKCNNVGIDQQIGVIDFNNFNNSPAYIGYMYNPDSLISYKGNSNVDSGSIFGKSVTYDNGYYILNETSSSYNSTHHYSCNNSTGKCRKVRYYYRYLPSYDVFYYVELFDGRNIEQVLDDMTTSSNINSRNSTIKSYIENWYANNLAALSSFIEETIFCNNRKVKNKGGWNSNGGSEPNEIAFQGSREYLTDLSCPNKTDQFSILNEIAKLNYSVGLMTVEEMNLLNNNVIRKTDRWYWLLSPNEYLNMYAYMTPISNDGSFGWNPVTGSGGVRPAISLKKNLKFVNGDGSKNNPYIVDTSNNFQIDIEIVNETEEINININDLNQIKQEEEVTFKVTPIKGFKVNTLKIVDSDNNEIDYFETENKYEYKFIMPASDVTIIPSYERVSNAINIEENKNTKQIKIEVNDATAVVYADKVNFTVTPEEGYEIENIEIKDKEGNTVEYRKTAKENEYEFIMPDTDVIITPVYRKKEISNNITNPKTGNKTIILITILFLIVFITYIIVRKKKKV